MCVYFSLVLLTDYFLFRAAHGEGAQGWSGDSVRSVLEEVLDPWGDGETQEVPLLALLLPRLPQDLPQPAQLLVGSVVNTRIFTRKSLGLFLLSLLFMSRLHNNISFSETALLVFRAKLIIT